LRTKGDVDAIRFVTNLVKRLAVSFTEVDVSKWVLFYIGARRSSLFTHLVLVSREALGEGT
jgi:hypothetical protein